jgi:cell division protease FtsH
VAPPDRRSPDDLRIAAVHEAGHAVAYLAFGRAIAAVSIVARGGSGGLTRARGPVSKLPRRGDIDDIIVTLLAGRAAEKAILGDASAGAEGDLAQATTILVEAHATQGLGDTLIHRADFSSLLAYDSGSMRAPSP